MINGSAKIIGAHLDRLAVVYLRQSSMAQVREHTESTMRQYGLGEEPVTLVRASLPGWLTSGAARDFDLALCDPPYDFSDWPALLDPLPAEIVVMESGAPVVLPQGWVVTKERRYGGTLVTVAHRDGTGS